MYFVQRLYLAEVYQRFCDLHHLYNTRALIDSKSSGPPTMIQVLSMCKRLATSRIFKLGDKKNDYSGRFTPIVLDDMDPDEVEKALTSRVLERRESECYRLAKQFL